MAERYHWTPAQCDELPLEFAEALPDMAAGWDLARQRAERRAHARAEAAQSQPQRPRFTGHMAG